MNYQKYSVFVPWNICVIAISVSSENEVKSIPGKKAEFLIKNDLNAGHIAQIS